MNPCPKPKTIRLKGKAYAKLRLEAWVRAGGCCEDCFRYVPLKGDTVFEIAHLSHIKSRGAGGSDTLDNVKIKCYGCHIGIEHGPRWSAGMAVIP
jgi:hypothetical protein